MSGSARSFSAVAASALVLLLALVAAGSSARAMSEGAPTHPELRALLTDLFQRDQAARKAMLRTMSQAGPPPAGAAYAEEVIPLVRAVQMIDAESRDFLRRMIDEQGWPTFAMVGQDGAEFAWLLAQHADADPALQQEVLALMRPLVQTGQAKPANLAYLEDRVLVARRLPQIYGTQFAGDPTGVQRPFPLAEPREVDARRAAMGLSSMARYAKQVRKATGARVLLEPLADYPPE